MGIKIVSTKKNQLNLEGFTLHYVDKEPYVILSQLHNVLGVKASFIANTAGRMGAAFTKKYVIKPIIELDGSQRPRKCVHVSGLIMLFARMASKVDKAMLNDLNDYIMELVKQGSKPKKARIVELNNFTTNEVNDVAVEISSKPAINIVEEEITTSVEECETTVTNEYSEYAQENVVSVVHNEETVTAVSENDLIDTPQDNSIGELDNLDSILNVMDGVLKMLSDSAALKEENNLLKVENNTLKETISRLQNELENSKAKSESILKKASLIKEYVLSNK